MTESQLKLLEDRRKKIKDAQDAHYQLAAKLKKQHNLIGIPLVVFTVFVGSSLFAELQTNAHYITNIVTGVISLIAAILAAIQTFLKLPEQANIHKTIAVQLGFLKKDIEEIIANPAIEEDELKNKQIVIRRKWDEIINEAPTIPNKLWETIKMKK